LSIIKIIRNTINGLYNLVTEVEKAADDLNKGMGRALEQQAERHAVELNELVGDSPYDGTVAQNEANKRKVEETKLNNEEISRKINGIR